MADTPITPKPPGTHKVEVWNGSQWIGWQSKLPQEAAGKEATRIGKNARVKLMTDSSSKPDTTPPA